MIGQERMVTGFDKTKYGYVFNIQQFTVHDGPGIRTMVFLKGCPLRCQWCSNPESQKPLPELGYKKRKCIGTAECGRCIEACVTGAIKKDHENRIMIDRVLCTDCLTCAGVCPSRALNAFGNRMSIDQVLKAVEDAGIFHSRSGGGMTLSGGEPFAQAEFSLELLKEAKKRRMNTAMETSGYTAWENLEGACRHLNTILFDIKSMHDRKHKEFTGVSNRFILENFEKMCTGFPNLSILVRTAIVPGFNDTEEDLFAIVDFIKGIPNVSFEPLAYHRFGQPKYEYLGRTYLLSEIKADEGKINVLKENSLRRFFKIHRHGRREFDKILHKAEEPTCQGILSRQPVIQ
jgi:pyruvate formate lyase activating enzyme